MSHYARQWAKRQSVGDSATKTVLKVYADWASEDYSTWVTNEELLLDTELNIQTIRKARTKLIDLGYLIETKKRIGATRSVVVYQMVAPPGSIVVQAMDPRTGETISLSPPTREEYESKSLQKRSPSKKHPPSAKSAKGDEKPSPSKNQAPPNPTSSPSKSHAKGGEIPRQAPPNFTPNKADIALESSSSSNAREDDAADNSLLLPPNDQNPYDPGDEAGAIAAAAAETEMRTWLSGLADCSIDPLMDRVHVLTWVGKGVSHEQLLEACRRARKRRAAARDTRLIGAKFLGRFIDEVLAEGEATAGATDEPEPAQWWLSDSGTGEQGRRVHVPRRPNETTPDYLVRVAQASGPGPWIDYVLKREQGSARYQQIVAFFGDELMPVDYYPS